MAMKLEKLEGMDVSLFPYFHLTNYGIGGAYKGTLGPRIEVTASRDGRIICAREIALE